MSKYDIAIIGGGPGGYVAALYAAGLGKKVLVIEKERLGGACLNWGCIPTKALITSAKLIDHIKRSKEFGIDVTSYTVDYKEIKGRKDRIVDSLKKGIETLFKSKKIELKKGFAKIADKGTIEVDGEKLEAKDIIIATGSRPVELPNFKFDHAKIITSADMLDLEVLPKKLLIVGGGVIGCEYAYLYSSLGVEITIVEMMDRLLPTMDRELGKNMEMLLKKKKVTVTTKTKLTEPPAEYDKILVCVGRKPNIEEIGLEKAGVKTEKAGIIVSERLKTNVPGIYAIGDVAGKYQLAHVASHEGIVACDNIMGKDSKIDYRSVPLCIYTEPQMASVGLTQQQAKEKGLNVKLSKFPFRSLGKSHVLNETEGFLKIISDEKSGEVLGIHLIGAEAALLVAEATMIVKHRMKAEDVAEAIHAHPTLSEAFMEAAFIAKGTPLHGISG